MWLTLSDKFLTEMIFLSCISPFKNNELLFFDELFLIGKGIDILFDFKQ